MEFARLNGKTVTQEAVYVLQSHAWPGNVRELRHAIDRASGLAGPLEPLLHAKDFEFLTIQTLEATPEVSYLPGVSKLKEMEKILILRALKLARGNRTEAARILGIARSTLFEMMKRHQIAGPKANDYWIASLLTP
jgi:transcriptional regulator with PAS, ATPase and Fis domain